MFSRISSIWNSFSLSWRKVFNKSYSFLDSGITNISSYIRKIALIIILTKAGLSLNISDLKKVGRPAILMSFLPAVVVPMMNKLIDEGYVTKKGIPQLIVAGSSIDDTIMIVFYQCFLSMESENHFLI